LGVYIGLMQNLIKKIPMDVSVASMNISETSCATELRQRPKAPTKQKKLSYLVGALVGGNALSTAINMVGGILMARMVVPSVLGLFSGIGLVLGYAPFFQIGIANGLNRELPYYIGKGDRNRAYELAAAAQAWLIAIGSLASIALLIVALYHLIQGNLWMAAGWGAYAILVFLFFYSNNYLQITYRTAHDFARLSMINVIQAVIGLVLLVLVWALDFYGLCLRAVFTAIIAASLFYQWQPVRVRPRWNFQHLKHLFVIGGPIYVVGHVYAGWFVIDRTLVLAYTGIHGMGLYSMVGMTSGVMGMLPVAFSQVIYPRMAEHYGRGASMGDLCRMTIKPMLLSAVCMAVLAAIAWWLVEPVTRLLVPKYIEAVPAMQWALFQPVIMCIAPINNVFNVIRKQKLYLAAILSGMAVYGVTLMWLIRGGVSLVAFPQAMLIGYMVFIAACYVCLYYLARKGLSCEK
jgi:O-antigen/teichoic acid export membrane protein